MLDDLYSFLCLAFLWTSLSSLTTASCQGAWPTLFARGLGDLLAVWSLPFLSLPISPHPFPEICCENKTSQVITISTSLCLHAALNGCSSPNSPLYLPCQHMETSSATDPRPQLAMEQIPAILGTTALLWCLIQG